MKLYVKNIETLPSPRMQHWFADHGEGKWIRALSGLKANRSLLEGRLREISSRLLGIANVNDVVMPTGSMLNTLQGLHRDTGVRVSELDLGVHESPFVCPDYQQPHRRFITEFLDEGLYGEAFAEFIKQTVSHFS